jgi:hypothetical protein
MTVKSPLLLLSATVLVACTSTVSPPEPISSAPEVPTTVATHFDPAWARDPLWDDGQAEVSLYEARRPQYGKIEAYEAVFIVVKEDFNNEFHVKADPPYENKTVLPVLKLNAVHSYWTNNYPYHFLASVFVRRDDPTRLVKLTLGSQEWCGTTFKEVRTWGAEPALYFHTYWDGQGDGSHPLNLHPGDLLEDQLPLALRGLKFQEGLELHLRILPSLISNSQRGPLTFQDAILAVVGAEQVATGAGRFAAWKVSVKMGELEQTWWFEKAAPHRLLKMDSSDGRSWLLKAVTRKPYWSEPTYRPEM